MIQAVDENNITLFVPLMAGGQASGFLDSISARINPTPDGLGAVDPATGAFKTISIPTGQEWSLTNLVKSKDPYFTWVEADLEQYTISDNSFLRHVGWRSKSGSQVIYFQNPAAITSAQLSALTSAIGPVTPGDVVTSVVNPLYAAGEVSCPSPLPSLKAPKFKLTAVSEGFMYFFVVVAAFLGIIVATALIQDPDSFIVRIGNSIAEWFKPRK